MGMVFSEEDIAKAAQAPLNLTALHKAGRPTKRKPGRKTPLPGDESPKKKSKQDEGEEGSDDDAINVDDAMDVSLQRDINYSRTVWMSGNNTFRMDLNTSDREIVRGERDEGWLNNAILDYYMAYLSHHSSIKFETESVLNARKSFTRTSANFIQIVNTDITGE